MHALGTGALLGREAELRRLQEALRKRQSLLIWGPPGAGKTALVHSLLGALEDEERRRCIYLRGIRTPRDLVSGLVEGFFAARDSIVREKATPVGRSEVSFGRWLRQQSSGRLKNLVYRAAGEGRYAIFLDDLAPATHPMAHLLKELIWRCKTPVYPLARGRGRAQIGHAWSIYFAPELCLHVDALPESAARELLERCIQRLGLSALRLDGFRESVLRLSRSLPGAIVRMCELAAQLRYQYNGRIKLKLVRVDYLMELRPGRVRA